MSNAHTVFSEAQRLKKQGMSAREIREQLIEDGWGIGAVDTALWRTGYRGWRSVFARQRIRRVAMIFGAIAFGAAVYGISLFAQQEAVQKAVRGAVIGNPQPASGPEGRPAEQLTDGGLVSSEAGISFDFPVDWSLSNLTEPSDQGGFVWQVEPVRNNAVRAELEKRYGIIDDENSAQDAADSILADPLATQLVTATITVAQEPYYDVEESIEDWKKSIDLIDTSTGFSISNFEKLTVNGIEGYTYVTTLETAIQKVSTRDYAFIKGDSRVEATTFPVESQSEQTLESIIQSISFLE